MIWLILIKILKQVYFFPDRILHKTAHKNYINSQIIKFIILF